MRGVPTSPYVVIQIREVTRRRGRLPGFSWDATASTAPHVAVIALGQSSTLGVLIVETTFEGLRNVTGQMRVARRGHVAS